MGSVGHALPITAAVLAGGKSRRMGTDKRILPVDGRPMVARVIDIVSEVCEETMLVVAHAGDPFDCPVPAHVRIVPDCVPEAGPLGGLVTALSEARTEWVLAVAADMPFIKAEVIRLLCEARGDGRAVAAVGSRGVEPLLAIYHVSCVVPALRLLESEKGSPRRLLSEVCAIEVPVHEVRCVDADLTSLQNVNTPREYERIIGASAGGRSA